MNKHASYIYDAYSFIHSLPNEQLLQVGNLEVEGSPIPSFDEDLLISLCEDVTKIFEKEENTLEIEGDIIVVGDIHGSFHDLLRILRYTETCNFKVIFLGDYVDRGNFSLECITLLFAMKILKPNDFYLLRGNHEFNSMCSCYGFKNEILNYHNPQKSNQMENEKIKSKKTDEINFNFDDVEKDQSRLNDDVYFANHANMNCYKYTENLYNAFMKAFSFLPICAIINNTSICIHGGLTPLLDKVENIQKQIQRPITDFDQSLLLSDIIWGDPTKKQSQIYSENQRGRGKLFNGPAVVNFLRNNNLKRLIRGHECVNNGIEILFNEKCITVFSASSYSCNMGNSSGILKIYQNEDKIEPIVFPPIYRLKKCDSNYYKVQSYIQNKMKNIKSKKNFLLSFAHINGSHSEHIVISQFHTSRASARNHHQNEVGLNSENSQEKESFDKIPNGGFSGRRKSTFHSLLPPMKSPSHRKSLNSPYICTPKISSQNSDITLNRCEYYE